MQLQTQCSYNFKDGVEVGAPLTGECLVETFARQASILCNLAHAFGPGNIAQRFGDKRGIAIGLLRARLQIRHHFLRSTKVLGDIVASGRSFAHHALLEIACETQGSFDVGDLCTFITAGQ